MWQTQSVEPVRTAHISVLLTVNTVSLSHNPAVLIIFPLNLQTITITRTLSSGGEGATNTATTTTNYANVAALQHGVGNAGHTESNSKWRHCHPASACIVPWLHFGLNVALCPLNGQQLFFGSLWSRTKSINSQLCLAPYPAKSM